MIVRPRRSVLYVPANNARAVAKCRTVDADAVVLDLEDSVAPAEKPAARRAAVEALREGGFGHREVVVRVNALDTPWGRDDLMAAAAARPAALLLPKVQRPGDVMFAAQDLSRAEVPETVRLWAMVETPAAVLGVADVARTAADPASRLDALVIGTNDLAKDLRVRVGPGRETLLVWLGACVAAARCHGLDVIDGVFNGLDDPDGLAAEAAQGRDYGMDGKTCIHPNQVAACNAAFAPSAGEVAAARRIVEAFDRTDAASVNVMRIDGRMVERLHADAARRVLAVAEAAAARDGGRAAAAL
ncbi:HpcH/HpaI aldolase/citrate lyase family protein [Lichenibacterium dinghuense]|uniref:HpcH/HpaI aldolase/citrate lyase family protein n=1 Tax=Lichenibacterium dinghuense TaxID=2895977 RepID=UPI001F2D3AD4|nr:CoA ester lyase [Lichenibacterium sp. 6Y81]